MMIQQNQCYDKYLSFNAEQSGVRSSRHQIIQTPVAEPLGGTNNNRIQPNNDHQYKLILPGLTLGTGIVVTLGNTIKKLILSIKKLKLDKLQRKRFLAAGAKKTAKATVGISFLAFLGGLVLDQKSTNGIKGNKG